MNENEKIPFVKTCPITKNECTFGDCSFFLSLEDFQGCPLELGEEALKKILTEGARKLDQIQNGIQILKKLF